MSNRRWIIRKGRDPDGELAWGVRRPSDVIPIVWFKSFDHLMLWQPDCKIFLNGYCHCRMECQR